MKPDKDGKYECEQCHDKVKSVRSFYHMWVCDKCDAELKDNDPE